MGRWEHGQWFGIDAVKFRIHIIFSKNNNFYDQIYGRLVLKFLSKYILNTDFYILKNINSWSSSVNN